MGAPQDSNQAPLITCQARPGGNDAWLLLGLGGLSLALQGWWLGPRLGGDSGRYLEAAQRLGQGLGLVGKQADFPAYNLLVHLAGAADGGPWPLIALQAGLSLLAGLALYAGGRQAFGRAAGLAAALAYLLWPDLQRWNFYLLTDGPFNSLLAICLGLSLLAPERPLAWLGLTPALLGLAFTRPEGALFLPPLAVGWLGLRRPGPALGLAALATALWLLHPPSPESTAEVMAQWRQGTVIWGYPPSLSGLDLEPQAHRSGLAAMLWAALRENPLLVLSLVARRVYWCLLHARPFYSTTHNLIAAGSSLAMLVLALWGSLTAQGGGARRLAPWAVVALQLALVGLTWADWDGRFLTRVTPALLLLAADALLGRTDPDHGPGRSGGFTHL